MAQIEIKTKAVTASIAEGKPVIVKWRTKDHQRPGVATALGWLKRGEKGQIKLVQRAFVTFDETEAEYASSWNIYLNSIVSIREIGGRK